MPPITRIVVNGTPHDVAAPPDTPLLYVLRNDLGLTGPKFGCGLGQCGACMVHIDGRAVRYDRTSRLRARRHTYDIPNTRVTAHLSQSSPLRTSSLRGLGSPQNSFANESFMDGLAHAAGVDPVEFRLRHLTDPRAIAVVRAAARLANWQPRTAPRAQSSGVVKGRGFGYARYDTTEAYVAVVVDVDVDLTQKSVRVTRVFAAHDCGLIVNPDGLRNQIEGNIIQAISRTLKERVSFDRSRVTGVDWQSYPILTFAEMPDAIEIELIDHPELPPVGAGEAATSPVPGAIANAIFDATGRRLRDVPLKL